MWYAAAREHRPVWVRVDRLCGEHGLAEDTAEGQAELARRMEQRRRAEKEEAALASIRQGWCLGSPEFRRQMLKKREGELSEGPAGALRWEHGEERAERIMAEELKRLGWMEADLMKQRKKAPSKLDLAARLRRETTMTLK